MGEEGVQQIMKTMVGGGLFLETIWTGMITGSTYHWSQLQRSQCFQWGGGWSPMGRGSPCRNSLRMLSTKQQKQVVKWRRWALCTGRVLYAGWVSCSGQLLLKRGAGTESRLCSWIHCRTSCFRHSLCIVSLFCTLLKEQMDRCLPRLQLTC